MAKVFKENWDAIATYWNTKKGLAFYFMIFISIYYGFISSFIKENLFESSLYRVWLIPFSFLTIIYIIWAFLSHRINLYKNEIITTGIFLKCNDSNSELQIKKIIADMIEDLEDQFKDIKFKIFPINHITSKSQLVRFVSKNNHIIDNAFFATVYNGNCIEESQTLSIIEIQNISFSAYSGNSNQTDFRNNINMSHDLSIRNLNKDWQFYESKSFMDKSKSSIILLILCFFLMGYILFLLRNMI